MNFTEQMDELAPTPMLRALDLASGDFLWSESFPNLDMAHMALDECTDRGVTLQVTWDDAILLEKASPHSHHRRP